ncbi:ADP-ribosylation factor-like protein 9 isoform X2 [Trichomycterus rosablanca]|uniref:ADP-ribosylation factor-like protein 9 isoform X2 n=1 Tax=Trichomycterus rosablanca TaxID=2290929 RepID=UPI002F353DE7
MPGVREVVLAGCALTLTGGLAFVVWNLIKNKKREKAQGSTQLSAGAKHGELTLVDEVVKAERSTPAAAAPSQSQASPSQVLFLGLDGAGKTSLLQCFATGSVEQDVSPTQGFNAVSINKEKLHIEFLEIGGKEELRDYWSMYLKKARVLVFVVDAADSSRFPLAKTQLHQILATDPSLPLVLLANKQDLPGACGVSELFESLALGLVGDARQLYILGTHVQNGSAVSSTRIREAFDLIVEIMNG